MHCTFARSIRRLFESSNIISIPSGSRLHADVELSAAYLFLCSSVDHTAFHVRQSRRSYQKPSKETRAFVVKSHTGLDTVPRCSPLQMRPPFRRNLYCQLLHSFQRRLRRPLLHCVSFHQIQTHFVSLVVNLAAQHVKYTPIDFIHSARRPSPHCVSLLIPSSTTHLDISMLHTPAPNSI